MFSHEGIALITLFSILVVGALVAVLHPLHALTNRILRRRERLSRISQKVNQR